MNKEWYKSRTIWGGILLSVEAGLLVAKVHWPWLEVPLAALGTFLTIFGYRAAIN